MTSAERKLPSLLRSLNHVSRVVSDVSETSQFYQDLLGFIPIRRPGGLAFDGAWLYSPVAHLGLHLIKGTPIARSSSIDPKADHLSFVCTSLAEVEDLLTQRAVPYVRQSIIEEEGVQVTQIFFHDPDNNMIEICNCDELPLELLADLACSSCQAKVAVAQQADCEWQGVPLGSASKSMHMDGMHDDAMSDHSSHSASEQAQAAHTTTLFASGHASHAASAELCCIVEPVQ